MIGGDKAVEPVLRALSLAACVMLAADLILIVATGGWSILTPEARVSQWAFVVREGLLAAVVVTRFRVLAPAERRLSAGRLMLMLAVFPALFHLHFIGRRITGDAVYYYVYTRSLIRDADVDFANEYVHYDLLKRGDFSAPTDTGHRRSIYSVGPGLMWTPFFVAADGLGSLLARYGLDFNPSGYGPLHVNAVALGSFCYGVAALFVIHALIRKRFGDRLAAGAVLLLWWASFLQWYLAEQPLTSHPLSVLLISTFLLLRERGALASLKGAMCLGLILGLSMSVRWQNGVFLLLPALDLVSGIMRRDAPTDVVKRGLAIAAFVLVGVAPQLLAWKAIYGEYFLPYPPHGADFLRLDRPFLLNTLFSSRHGLLSWTPVFWLCLAGMILLAKQNARHFAILWAPVLIVTYVNACSGDWWAGGAYSNRRFDSLLPIFALGLAAFLQSAIGFVKRRPSAVLVGLVICGAVWSGPWARAVQLGEAPSEIPVSFAARSFASTRVLSHEVGFPTTWPASWIFALRYRASPGDFDLAAGKYLFYRQNNLDGVVDLGEEGDEGLFLDGLARRRQDGPISYRGIDSVARLVVSLDLPESLGLWVHARAPESSTTVMVAVNGNPVGSVQFAADWEERHLETPKGAWKRGANIVSLRSAARVDLDRINFVRSVR